MRISLFRRAHFNAAHRLYVPGWSDEKNLEVFGKCANPNYHGHNYEIEVKVTGEVDAESGILMNLKDLKNIIKVHVEEKLDHQNLNLDVREFDQLVPTAENICYIIWKILREVIEDRLELTVRLFETPRNYVEYPAS
jgi:6-pyruvoyltetrahydropterin/6-carboxytetrahydropterin synthase